jgi:UDP-N-acetylmuramate dehydrogenase
MALAPSIAAALRRAGLVFAMDVPLAKRTSWRVGGPADALVSVSSVRELVAVQRLAADTDTPVAALGNGSNVLVADAGWRGLVVVLEGALAGCEADGGAPPALTVGAGLRLAVLLARAKKHGWTGLACFAGIPGTVGGAIRMNAGSTLGETVETLIEVDGVLRGGALRTWAAAELAMSYRTCRLPDGAILAVARLRTTGEDALADQDRTRAFVERRKATQPLDLPSGGSTFRNPPGDAAGRLIEAAGLKGFTIGRAQVSERHANFIVNLGDATAADIRRVVEHVQAVVRDRWGVGLEQEVLYAGDWRLWDDAP